MTSSPTSLAKVQIYQKLDKIPERNIPNVTSKNPGAQVDVSSLGQRNERVSHTT